MKRIIVILLLLFNLALLNLYFPKAAPVEKITVSEVQTKRVERNIPYFKSQLNIPVIKIEGNRQVSDKINRVFQEDALNFSMQVEEAARKTYEELTKAGIEVTPYEATSQYQIHRLKDYLSIVVTYYQYTGGAHGISQLTSYNYDLSTGQRLKLKDIFKLGFDYKEVINKVINEAIARNPGEFFPGAFTGVSDEQDFYLGEKGITVYFQNYEIAPYAAGNPEFFIPYSSLKEGLNIRIK